MEKGAVGRVRCVKLSTSERVNKACGGLVQGKVEETCSPLPSGLQD